MSAQNVTIRGQASQSKPPYRVPTMEEIEASPWNGYKVVSTFSGAGGSCLGYRMASYRVLWANEFIPAAQETYKANHPHSILDIRDIRKIQPEDILLATKLYEGDIDILDGSPPCASFSTAGKRAEHWGKVKEYSDTRQRVDDLFFEYVRLLKGLQPKVFVAENVSGLVKGAAKGYFIEIHKALQACGYTVSARLLDAQWLGVLQKRQRIIFVGIRNDLVKQYRVKPVHPQPLPYYYTVREALPWVIRQGDNGGFGKGGWQDAGLAPSGTLGASPNTGNGTYPPSLVEVIPIRALRDDRGAFGNGGDITDQPSPTRLSDSVGPHWIEEQVIEPESDISKYAIGAECPTLRQGEQSSKYFQLVKPSLNEPCPTITQRGGDNTVASVTHPIEKRKFTIAELKRLCAFPADFVLTGSYAQQWERLGRAVPPVMMRHVAQTIKEQILDKCK